MILPIFYYIINNLVYIAIYIILFCFGGTYHSTDSIDIKFKKIIHIIQGVSETTYTINIYLFRLNIKFDLYTLVWEHPVCICLQVISINRFLIPYWFILNEFYIENWVF